MFLNPEEDGSIGWNVGKLLHLSDYVRRTATISGMAAFFSALFGTPLTAALFAMMVEDVGLTFTSAFMPAFTSALIAYGVSLFFGIAPTNFVLNSIPHLTLETALQTALLGIACAAVTRLFCWTLHTLEHERFRADKLIEDFAQENNIELDGSVDGWSNEKMVDFIESHNIPCPSCGKHNFTDIRQFNLMFKTFQGVTEDAKNTVYLRPETAQGIFVNFKNVQRTSRKKIPFGIGQIGKSFRNEITPGNFTFRTREFEQMELEFFCEPGTDLEWFQYWRAFCRDWLLSLGIKEDEMRLRDHSAEELCFYSKGTTDIEFLFPFGWGELWGIADRTDYDLTQHQNVSGQDMTYFDDTKGEKYIPYVIEPSLGADRVVLAFLCAAYDEENIGTEEKPDVRTVFHFPSGTCSG